MINKVPGGRRNRGQKGAHRKHAEDGAHKNTTKQRLKRISATVKGGGMPETRKVEENNKSGIKNLTRRSLNWATLGVRLGNVTGDPGVFFGNPHPYP
jgi:hypothetical protein